MKLKVIITRVIEVGLPEGMTTSDAAKVLHANVGALTDNLPFEPLVQGSELVLLTETTTVKVIQ
jgi:hypothetical protein